MTDGTSKDLEWCPNEVEILQTNRTVIYGSV